MLCLGMVFNFGSLFVVTSQASCTPMTEGVPFSGTLNFADREGWYVDEPEGRKMADIRF